MMLNDSTVITQALEAIAPTIRTFLEADVCIFQVFSSLIRFQESPASVAVYVTVEYIRDDRFVMQCDECKKVTLQEVCVSILFSWNDVISGCRLLRPLPCRGT